MGDHDPLPAGDARGVVVALMPDRLSPEDVLLHVDTSGWGQKPREFRVKLYCVGCAFPLAPQHGGVPHRAKCPGCGSEVRVTVRETTRHD
jgi:predicted RNA-binding Zn-ribbon protein involved in translation (DUF1610 family)